MWVRPAFILVYYAPDRTVARERMDWKRKTLRAGQCEPPLSFPFPSSSSSMVIELLMEIVTEPFISHIQSKLPATLHAVRFR